VLCATPVAGAGDEVRVTTEGVGMISSVYVAQVRALIAKLSAA